jgi:hypothetical protein
VRAAVKAGYDTLALYDPLSSPIHYLLLVIRPGVVSGTHDSPVLSAMADVSRNTSVEKMLLTLPNDENVGPNGTGLIGVFKSSFNPAGNGREVGSVALVPVPGLVHQPEKHQQKIEASVLRFCLDKINLS